MKSIRSSTDDPYRILRYVAEESSFTGRVRFDPREVSTVDMLVAIPINVSYYSYEASTGTLAAIDSGAKVWIWYPGSTTWVTTC